MKVLVPVANGSEEMEAVILVDVLRRAGWEVVLAGLDTREIEASRGVTLRSDLLWTEIDPLDFDLLLLPGGWNGTMAFCKHEGLLQALRAFDAAGKWIGAICAAPLALHAAGILEGKAFTCYPGVEKELPAGFVRSDERVVRDDRLFTSQGPGTAFELALRLIADLDDPARSTEVRSGLLL